MHEVGNVVDDDMQPTVVVAAAAAAEAIAMIGTFVDQSKTTAVEMSLSFVAVAYENRYKTCIGTTCPK